MYDLFISQISLKEEIEPSEFDSYPLNISALNFFISLKLTHNVTIFNGENGCGKSTIIEALADLIGLPVTGGNHYMGAFIETNQTLGKENASLAKYLRIGKGYKKPRHMYFFRAESFHELSAMIDEDAKKGGYDSFLSTSNYTDDELLGQSHGESFMDLLQHQMKPNGLYILDEPESALSPQNQLKLLCLINQLEKNGSQFIIATHSPILLGYRNAQIINLDNGMRVISYKDTNIYNLYKRFINDPYSYQDMLFDNDED